MMLKRLRTLSLELVFELSGDVLCLGFTFGASPNFPLSSRRIGIGNARINLSALLLYRFIIDLLSRYTTKARTAFSSPELSPVSCKQPQISVNIR
jgi:hypothetical protein